MQYKFDRKYLKSLLEDSQMKFETGEISKEDHELLLHMIKELIYGADGRIKKTKIDSLNLIQSNLRD